LGLRLERARVALAVGHVHVPVAGEPAAARDVDEQVGARAEEAELAEALERRGVGADLGRQRLPVADRVAALLHAAGAEDEVLVVGERHLSLLRESVRRVGEAAPAGLAPLPALAAPLAEDAPALEPASLAWRVNLRERVRVDLAPHGHRGVDVLHSCRRNGGADES